MEPVQLESIQLQLYTDAEVRKLGVVQVTNPSTYDRGFPKANGVNDARMGVTDKSLQCPTCGLTSTCHNHYGFIELERPVLRLGHVASVLCILRCVCWACSRPKFSTGPDCPPACVDVRAIVARTPASSKERLRALSEACKNRFRCPWGDCDERPCGVPQPVYARVNKVFFSRNFRLREAGLFESDEERAYAARRLMPDEVRSILHHVPDDALRMLGYRPEVSHPENYVMQAHLVPPPSIRPASSASSTEARMRGENDLTTALQDIVRANNELAAACAAGEPARIETAWDKLQIFCAALINQNVKKLPTFGGVTVVHARAMGKRKVKDMHSRLVGKKGRLRSNMSGKRVDHAGRSVVGPDASHDIFQLGVPASIMRTLTFPEPVNALNSAELARAVTAGAAACRGALTVRLPEAASGGERVLYVALLDESGRRDLAAQLKPGWIVERHLRDGDWVLFNRQPSLHKASIMAFRAYEVPGAQFKLPLPCTKPFNADFDGDEMNVHALQDYTALAEAQEIMAVPHQMVTPQSNSVIIALVQDSLVGAYLMSRRDAFVSREQAMQLAMCIHHAPDEPGYGEMPLGGARSFADNLRHGHLPQPAVLKGASGQPRWTGKQLCSWLLPPSLSLVRGVSGGDPSSLEDVLSDAVVVVRQGVLVAGRLCKQSVGGTSSGIVHALWKQRGAWAAAKFVSDAQRLMMAWLRHDTLSISIADCLTGCEGQVDAITAEAMGKVDAIARADVPAQVKEVRQAQVLQETLRTVGAAVLKGMNHGSGIATVVASGSKGNLMNIAQIAGLVGQQTVNGTRVPFRRGPCGLRTLANFAPDDNSPEARGFVASSYLMGLQPAEFFFHQQAGREGVVATAVSTADSGYNQRRMIKNQESEVVAYDGSVRVSSNLVVQLHYGSDDYDGSLVERVKLPVLEARDADAALCALGCAQTPPAERAWLRYAWQTLCAAKRASAVYGGEFAAEVVMPVNLERVVASALVGRPRERGAPPANAERMLARMLWGVLELHSWIGTPEGQLGVRADSPVLELLALPRRDWCAADDASQPARLCLALQCNTAFLRRAALCAEQEDAVVGAFLRQYARGIVNPGEGVGAVGSSCIGEPATQMSVTYDTRICWRGRVVLIGELIDGMLLRHATLPVTHAADTDTHVVDVSSLRVTIDTVDARGVTSQQPVTACIRHPPNGQLVRVTLQSGRHVTGTLAKSFLVRSPDGLAVVPINGSELRVGMCMPVARGSSSEAGLNGVAWDPITDLDVHDTSDPYVYDLTVPATLNFGLANGVYVRDTLNIFHYSGIAEKNVTLTGLPRFKQIINAVDTPDTSNMRIYLTADALGGDRDAHKFNARAFAARLVKTSLHQVVATSCVVPAEGEGGLLQRDAQLCAQLDALCVRSTQREGAAGFAVPAASRGGAQQLAARRATDSRVANALHASAGSSAEGAGKRALKRAATPPTRLSSCVVRYELDKAAVCARHLSVDDVGAAVAAFMGADAQVTWSARWAEHWLVLVRPPAWGEPRLDRPVTDAVHDALLEHALVNGIDVLHKALPARSPDGGEWVVETEGSSLLELAQLVEVDALRTTTNNIQEAARVLGVEAAACLLQAELHRVLAFDGSYVDPRHTWLLADTVTRSGCVNPLNRHKMEELGGSLLQCASFEQTLDVFEHGAAFGKQDTLGGATEKLIVGQPVHVGTGSFAVLAPEGGAAEDERGGSFVAPLHASRPASSADDDAMLQARVQRVGALAASRCEPGEQVVLRLGHALRARCFAPPAPLPSSPLLAVSPQLAALFGVMRKHAQRRMPVWVAATLWPLDAAPMGADEFGDIDQALSDYTGWTERPALGDFRQVTVVDFFVNDTQRVESSVQYDGASVCTTQRTREQLAHASASLPAPCDAWELRGSAFTWQDVPLGSLPPSVTPVSVSIRQEKRFVKGAWTFRLTRAWEGLDNIRAEALQRGGARTASHSVAVELEKPWELLEVRGSTDAAMAGAMLERAVACIQTIDAE